LAGGIVGIMFLIVVVAVRSPRDTIVLEIEPDPDPNRLQVWVGGEVARPGLYTLIRGARVADALEAAGGVLESGDTAGLGLAAPLEDADQVIVPVRSKVAATAPAAGTAPAEPASSGLININTASAAELIELPGIGEALSARIIEYRAQHGPFQSIDELAEVSGISDRMVDELRDLITTGT
jgi:competence protein ComEA